MPLHYTGNAGLPLKRYTPNIGKLDYFRRNCNKFLERERNTNEIVIVEKMSLSRVVDLSWTRPIK